MAGTTQQVDPRLARRRARQAEILDAAWEIAGDEGLAAVNLHEVARRVGLRQPSLYAYFDSKAGLYDLMYAQGYTDLLERLAATPLPDAPRPAVVRMARLVVDFQVSEPARAQLLFQRTVPGFEPSPASYALAQQFLARFSDRLFAAGARDDADVDVFTALVAGIAGQQTANEPGGTRWTRHLETVLGLYFTHLDGDARAGSPAPS
jgi:AcrR family transcriptional regulator